MQVPSSCKYSTLQQDKLFKKDSRILDFSYHNYINYETEHKVQLLVFQGILNTLLKIGHAKDGQT